MKKMIFTVAACMAFAATSFATTGEKTVQPKLTEVTVSECLWSVVVIGKDGKEITRKEHKGTEGGVECLGLAQSQVKAYEEKYPNATVKYIAGGTSN
jgi:hypothetical protein